MNLQDIMAQRRALENLPERDKRILALARRISNNLGFALQNTHSYRIKEKYERASEEAMEELVQLLLTPSVTPASVDAPLSVKP